jgi:hypothetical protein
MFKIHDLRVEFEVVISQVETILAWTKDVKITTIVASLGVGLGINAQVLTPPPKIYWLSLIPA